MCDSRSAAAHSLDNKDGHVMNILIIVAFKVVHTSHPTPLQQPSTTCMFFFHTLFFSLLFPPFLGPFILSAVVFAHSSMQVAYSGFS